MDRFEVVNELVEDIKKDAISNSVYTLFGQVKIDEKFQNGYFHLQQGTKEEFDNTSPYFCYHPTKSIKSSRDYGSVYDLGIPSFTFSAEEMDDIKRTADKLDMWRKSLATGTENYLKCAFVMWADKKDGTWKSMLVFFFNDENVAMFWPMDGKLVSWGKKDSVEKETNKMEGVGKEAVEAGKKALFGKPTETNERATKEEDDKMPKVKVPKIAKDIIKIGGLLGAAKALLDKEVEMK